MQPMKLLWLRRIGDITPLVKDLLSRPRRRPPSGGTLAGASQVSIVAVFYAVGGGPAVGSTPWSGSARTTVRPRS